MTSLLPILRWAPGYRGSTLVSDAMAAAIVTIMLIPQSLAYASIAGLPPEVGLYASILPLVAYAIFGTSNTLAVGPVAVLSLMTATVIGRFAEAGSLDYLVMAMTLALLTGAILIAFGALRLGFLANFLSHSIISGFITASGLLIAASQLRHILGVTSNGHTLFEIIAGLVGDIGETNIPTAVIGVASIAFLYWTRHYFSQTMQSLGAPERLAASVAKAGPLLTVIGATAVVFWLGLETHGVAIVGDVPQGLPPFALPDFDYSLLRDLAGPAFLIAVIGYVESISVAQTLAAKRRERIDPDQEMIGLGAANLAAGVSGGFPVTGGFARSVVNFDAGARTPAAGAFAAVGIALAALFLTPLLFYLPRATLAATIIVAVLSLINIGDIKRTWIYSKSDFAAMAITILGVFLFGVETGVVSGMLLSIALLLYRASKPHYAIVGQVPGTEHFRNVRRHAVITSPEVAAIRIDGNLFFANARFLEDHILKLVADNERLKHVVLMCSAISEVDASALESLETLNERLAHAGVKFHLSEVKGPVMDRLKRTHFLDALSGRVFLSQFEAMNTLDPEIFQAPNGGLDNLPVVNAIGDIMTGQNFFSLLRAHTFKASEKSFLTMACGRSFSYGEIDKRSARIAGALLSEGLTPGDRIVVQVEKSPENVALYLAAMRAGLIYVPLNTGYTSEEVEYFLRNAEPSVLVCDPARASAYEETARHAGTQHLFTLDAVGGGTLMEAAACAPPFDDIQTRHADDLAVILYTSGTTGRSKGAMLTHDNLASNAIALNRLWGFSPEDVLLHTLPIFHIHGLFVALHTAMLSACEILFLPKFDAGAVRDALPRASVMMGVPTFYTRLLGESDFGESDAAHMRLFISGSAPLTEEVFNAFEARTGHRILERYGMSEAGMIASNPLGGERLAGTVGYALPGVSVRVTDDAGSPARAEETGNVEVKGPNVFKGYWRNPEKTAEEFTADGYFKTGDIGALSEDGRLTLMGRSKDLIIAGGYNIYPKEIEQVLDAVEGIAESAVIGAPHADMGEGVVAVLVPEKAQLDDAVLNEALEQLAKFKRPRKFFWLDALPRNAMGKVQKQALREQFKKTFD